MLVFFLFFLSPSLPSLPLGWLCNQAFAAWASAGEAWRADNQCKAGQFSHLIQASSFLLPPTNGSCRHRTRRTLNTERSPKKQNPPLSSKACVRALDEVWKAESLQANTPSPSLRHLGPGRRGSHYRGHGHCRFQSHRFHQTQRSGVCSLSPGTVKGTGGRGVTATLTQRRWRVGKNTLGTGRPGPPSQPSVASVVTLGLPEPPSSPVTDSKSTPLPGTQEA